MNNSLFIAWRSGDPANGRWGPVGRLEHDGNGYRFVYLRGAKRWKGFLRFRVCRICMRFMSRRALFPLFANRLLAPSVRSTRRFSSGVDLTPTIRRTLSPF